MARPPEDEPFFARWSKRKRAAEDAPEPAAETPPEPEIAPEADDSISPEELAALPAVDDFTPQTDIRPFLRKGVPKSLRHAALRRMWLLTPAIRDHNDPAVDYAWDWNTPGGVPGDGAAPSVERAAEMLRDLVTPRRNAEPQTDLENHEKPPPETPTPAPVSAPQHCPPSEGKPPREPVSGAEDTVPLRKDNLEEKQSGNDAPPPRKRHGSALPH